ncbi:hypothetical protein LOZ58_000803 [Ophidiomyces ophidiicola]|nr:hypothetical protein LOZ58_000803 [Ophidiomyces ophidiicola]
MAAPVPSVIDDTSLKKSTEDGGRLISGDSSSKGVRFSNTVDSSHPPEDPAQFFLDFAAQLSTFSQQSGKRERLVRKLRQQDTLLARATDRQFQYPSYLSRRKLAREEEMDQLAKIDEQLEQHKKRQIAFSKTFARMVANIDMVSQVRQDTDTSLVLAQRALKTAEAAIAQQKNINEEPTIKNIRSQLQSQFDKTKQLAQSLSENTSRLKGISSQYDSLNTQVVNISKASAKSPRRDMQDMSKCLEATEESFSTQCQLLEGRISELENRKATPSSDLDTLKSDIENLSYQLEKLREIQEQKDNEIDREFQRVDTGRVEISDKLSAEYALLKKEVEARILTFEEKETRQNLNAEIAKIRTAIKFQFERLGAHDVAVTSLESRYNKLSSEPIVRQMVASMQEMYPYASTAQKEIGVLKENLKELTNRLNAISAQLQAVDASQAVLKRIQDTEKLERATMIKDMNSEKNRISKSIEDVVARLGEMENITSGHLAKAIYQSEESLSKAKALEERLNIADKPESLGTLSDTQLNLTAVTPPTRNGNGTVPIMNYESEKTRLSGTSSTSSLSSSKRLLAPNRPVEPKGHRQDFRNPWEPSVTGQPNVRSPEAYTNNEAPRAAPFGNAPLSQRTSWPNSGDSLQHQASYPQLEGNSYRPYYSPRKRRRTNGFSSSDDDS